MASILKTHTFNNGNEAIERPIADLSHHLPPQKDGKVSKKESSIFSSHNVQANLLISCK